LWRLASGSFDGTVKLWNFDKENFSNNLGRASFVTLDGAIDEKKAEIKCGCSLWSEHGKYLITTFLISPRNRKDKDHSNIIIYSYDNK